MHHAHAPAHALVTGTSGAIGGALALELRRRHPALAFTLVDRDERPSAALARDLGSTRAPAVAVAHDLSRTDTLPALVDRARAAHGPIDLLVNCAGIMDVRRFDETPWTAADTLLTVDFLAPLRLMSLVVPDMTARGAGAVVNVTSMAGRVPLKGCAYYGAAKAGLSMASEIANAELAPAGVHVLTVYPGPVRSALERGARAGFEAALAARAIPTGDAAALATKIANALAKKRSRVIYPAAYGLGFHAGGLASAFTLAAGPNPRSQPVRSQ